MLKLSLKYVRMNTFYVNATNHCFVHFNFWMSERSMDLRNMWIVPTSLETHCKHCLTNVAGNRCNRLSFVVMVWWLFEVMLQCWR